MTHLEDFDLDEYWNDETDTVDLRQIKVTCRGCGRQFAALLSPYTREEWSGWEWVGFSHREPVTRHKTRCRKCNTEFSFKTRVGQ